MPEELIQLAGFKRARDKGWEWKALYRGNELVPHERYHAIMRLQEIEIHFDYSVKKKIQKKWHHPAYVHVSQTRTEVIQKIINTLHELDTV